MSSTAKSTKGAFRFSLKDSFKSLESNPEKESLIIVHFSFKGKRFKKSIGYKCSLNNWDINKQRVKTGKRMLSNAYEINAYIDKIQTYIQEEVLNMKRKFGTLNLDQLSSLLECKINGSQEQSTNEENQKLVNYAKKLMESKKRSVQITTCRACNQTIKMLEKYQVKNNIILKFDEIDLSFYRNFITLLEDENYSLNSIGKHIKNLKIFLNDALINGITSNIIFKNKSFRVLKETTTDIYLTTEEIKTLAEKDFSNRPRIELARDIFLIGCYTGQRVSDYNGLTNENMETIEDHKYIKLRQKKTNTPVLIPITKNIVNIMRRYKGNFPPKLSEPVLRKNIKTACSSAGLKEMISVSYTKGGKSIKKEVPKYSLVKTHTARRSFCTNYYIAGKPIQNIMLFSGHKTEKEFLRYIRIEKKQEAIAVHQSGFFD